MVFLELVLAHLLGDFVFQSNDLILKKYKSWTGTFQHVLIIAFFTVLLLFPFWHHVETWLVAGIIFGVHFVQDVLKVEFDVRFNQKKKSTFPYFADQILHLLLITYLSPFFDGLEPLALPEWLTQIYFSKELVVYLMGLVLFSFTYDITLFQFERQKSKKAIEFKADYARMGQRLLFFSVAYVLILILNSSFV